MKVGKEELDEKYNRILSEKEDMNKKFEIVAEQLRMRADFKNNILDEKLNQNQEELKRKETQLHEMIQRSGLNPGTVDDICMKMKEAIETKNSLLKNLRYSLNHATKAYNDAIRVYEAKLIEFGIPAEELGLELLETNTSTMPAGLVAA
jgi:growth arrest-specific protein 8